MVLAETHQSFLSQSFSKANWLKSKSHILWHDRDCHPQVHYKTCLFSKQTLLLARHSCDICSVTDEFLKNTPIEHSRNKHKKGQPNSNFFHEKDIARNCIQVCIIYLHLQQLLSKIFTDSLSVKAENPSLKHMKPAVYSSRDFLDAPRSLSSKYRLWHKQSLWSETWERDQSKMWIIL